MKFTSEQLETIYYACADAEKFWRHKRREVNSGACTQYTVEQCNDKMKGYHSMWNDLALQLNY